MVDTALIPYPDITTQMGKLNAPQIRALLKMQKEFERSKDKDRLFDLGKSIVTHPVTLLIGGLVTSEWLIQNEHLTSFGGNVLSLSILTAVIAREGGLEGVADIVSAATPWPW